MSPGHQVPRYAATPDGQRFLLLGRGPARQQMIHLLLNWLALPQR